MAPAPIKVGRSGSGGNTLRRGDDSCELLTARTASAGIAVDTSFKFFSGPGTSITMASSEQESGAMSSQNGYSTITHNGFAANEADAEGASLLRKPTQNDRAGSSVVTRLHKHFTADVSKSWADIALLGCYIITGLLDSSSVFIWGSFVSMQTGKARAETPQAISIHPLTS
jgi:hypothetical protein